MTNYQNLHLKGPRNIGNRGRNAATTEGKLLFFSFIEVVQIFF